MLLQVVSEFQKNGMEFIMKAINHPTYLEDLNGLTELQMSANLDEPDWDYEYELNNEECAEI